MQFTSACKQKSECAAIFYVRRCIDTMHASKRLQIMKNCYSRSDLWFHTSLVYRKKKKKEFGHSRILHAVVWFLDPSKFLVRPTALLLHKTLREPILFTHLTSLYCILGDLFWNSWMAFAVHESDLDILMYSAKYCICLFLFSRQSNFF